MASLSTSIAPSFLPTRRMLPPSSSESNFHIPRNLPSLRFPSQKAFSHRLNSRSSKFPTRAKVSEIKESDFRSVVLESQRPVLVEFVATWCGPCRLITPAMAAIAEEYADRLSVVKIDHDANPSLIEEYKVYGLPTFILFINGVEVEGSRKEGAITKVKLKEYVDNLLESVVAS